MLERIPFQIQGRPTVTLYEKIGYFEILLEHFPHSEPQIVGLVYALPVGRAVSDGPLDAAPGLTGVVLVLPVDRAVSDAPANAAPKLSGVAFVLPVPRAVTENELDSGPMLASMASNTPVTRSTTEPDPLNSAPNLSAMTVI